MSIELMRQIEKRGVVGPDGQRIYGTAALLYFLHRPIKSFSREDIELGKRWCYRHLGIE